eukprot:jgi/Tetstr1/458602/TSEL_045005.t1
MQPGKSTWLCCSGRGKTDAAGARAGMHALRRPTEDRLALLLLLLLLLLLRGGAGGQQCERMCGGSLWRTPGRAAPGVLLALAVTQRAAHQLASGCLKLLQWARGQVRPWAGEVRRAAAEEAGVDLLEWASEAAAVPLGCGCVPWGGTSPGRAAVGEGEGLPESPSRNSATCQGISPRWSSVARFRIVSFGDSAPAPSAAGCGRNPPT